MNHSLMMFTTNSLHEKGQVGVHGDELGQGRAALPPADQLSKLQPPRSQPPRTSAQPHPVSSRLNSVSLRPWGRSRLAANPMHTWGGLWATTLK